MREINQLVSEINGRYFVCVYGDEVLLKATTENEAIIEADELICQMDAETIAMEVESGYLR